jgi:hypothetical protein
LAGWGKCDADRQQCQIQKFSGDQLFAAFGASDEGHESIGESVSHWGSAEINFTAKSESPMNWAGIYLM